MNSMDNINDPNAVYQKLPDGKTPIELFISPSQYIQRGIRCVVHLRSRSVSFTQYAIPIGSSASLKSYSGWWRPLTPVSPMPIWM